MKNKITTKRIIALTTLICFLIVSAFLGIFILNQLSHNHDHDGIDGSCMTCTQIQGAENTLKQLSMAFSGAVAVMVGVFILIRTVKAIAICTFFYTPVTLKIKMNN